MLPGLLLLRGCAGPVKVHEGEAQWPAEAARVICEGCRFLQVDGESASEAVDFGGRIEVAAGPHKVRLLLTKPMEIIPIMTSSGMVFVPLPTCGALFKHETQIALEAVAGHRYKVRGVMTECERHSHCRWLVTVRDVEVNEEVVRVDETVPWPEKPAGCEAEPPLEPPTR
jgi:hypothetical protein